MPGLFIQRQAEVLAQEHQIVVLYLHPEEESFNDVEIDIAEESGIQVVRVYFRIPSKYLGILYPGALARFYQRALGRGIEVLGDFMPDVVHSHILTRIPLWVIGWQKSGMFHILFLSIGHAIFLKTEPIRVSTGS